MQVRLVLVGRIRLNHEGDVVDVNTAGGNVGRDEHAGPAVREPLERTGAARLVEVAMQGGDANAGVIERIREHFCVGTGAGENNDLLFASAQFFHNALLLVVVDHENAVVDRAGILVFATHLEHDGVGEVLLDNRGNARVERGREQHPLTVIGRVRQDAVDRLGKAQLCHVVGLVQNGDLDLREVELLLAVEVFDAAGRADHDVDAAQQCGDLTALRHAAHDLSREQADRAGDVLHRAVDLQGEFAGRRENERARCATRLALALGLVTDEQAFDDRCGKRDRLAGAGAAAAEHVATRERFGDRGCLDRERLCGTQFCKRFADAVSETEIGKALLGLLGRHDGRVELVEHLVFRLEGGANGILEIVATVIAAARGALRSTGTLETVAARRAVTAVGTLVTLPVAAELLVAGAVVSIAVARTLTLLKVAARTVVVSAVLRMPLAVPRLALGIESLASRALALTERALAALVAVATALTVEAVVAVKTAAAVIATRSVETVVAVTVETVAALTAAEAVVTVLAVAAVVTFKATTGVAPTAVITIETACAVAPIEAIIPVRAVEALRALVSVTARTAVKTIVPVEPVVPAAALGASSVSAAESARATVVAVVAAVSGTLRAGYVVLRRLEAAALLVFRHGVSSGSNPGHAWVARTAQQSAREAIMRDRTRVPGRLPGAASIRFPAADPLPLMAATRHTWNRLPAHRRGEVASRPLQSTHSVKGRVRRTAHGATGLDSVERHTEGMSGELRPIVRRDGFLPIEDHAIIGNGSTCALVARDGSLPWMCIPDFDEPPLFAAILDAERGGACSIAPVHSESASLAEVLEQGNTARAGGQRYVDDTAVTHTIVEGPCGRIKITDALTLVGGVDLSETVSTGRDELVRRTEALVDSRVAVMVRPASSWSGVARFSKLMGGWRIRSPKHADLDIYVWASHELEVVDTPQGETLAAIVDLKAGEKISLIMHWGGSPRMRGRGSADKLLKKTEKVWKRWGESIEPLGPRPELVKRSAITLKTLQHARNGSIVAAATSSLPEEIGGERNWDYRFTWVRDAAFSNRALRRVGAGYEADSFLAWVLANVQRDGGKPRIMYAINGRRVPYERDDPVLRGYLGSSPVHWGNGAATQTQNDVYGEIVDCAFQWVNAGGRLTDDMFSIVHTLVEDAIQAVKHPDHGIWEIRGTGRPFTYSTALCQVAVDRSILIGELTGNPVPKHWREEADRIREMVLKGAWSEKRQSFTENLGETEEAKGGLDSAILTLPMRGLVAYDDPRMVKTVNAVTRDLSAGNGLLYRYHQHDSPDGLKGTEGAFLLCSFWHVDNLAGQGRIDEATDLYNSLCDRANEVGLLSEEVDPESGAFLGNFPQAFSHVGVIQSGISIEYAKHPERHGAGQRYDIEDGISTDLS